MKRSTCIAIVFLMMIGIALANAGCEADLTGDPDSCDNGDDDSEGDDDDIVDDDSTGDDDSNGDDDEDDDSSGDDDDLPCDQACEKLVACDIRGEDEWEECMELCEDWGFDFVECVLDNECQEIEESCFDETELEGECIDYCDKLLDCEAMEEEEWEECFDECHDMHWEIRDCVLDSECDDLDECWEDDECADYCDKLLDCDAMEEEEWEECFDECHDMHWEIRECVLESECYELDECWEEPDCDHYCDKLVECDLMAPEEYDECMESCPDESWEEIECVIVVECEFIVDYCY